MNRQKLKALIRNQTCDSCIYMRYVPITFTASQEAMDSFGRGEEAYGKMEIGCICDSNNSSLPEVRTCKRWEKAEDRAFSSTKPLVSLVDKNGNVKITKDILSIMHNTPY